MAYLHLSIYILYCVLAILYWYCNCVRICQLLCLIASRAVTQSVMTLLWAVLLCMLGVAAERGREEPPLVAPLPDGHGFRGGNEIASVSLVG